MVNSGKNVVYKFSIPFFCQKVRYKYFMSIKSRRRMWVWVRVGGCGYYTKPTPTHRHPHPEVCDQCEGYTQAYQIQILENRSFFYKKSGDFFREIR